MLLQNELKDSLTEIRERVLSLRGYLDIDGLKAELSRIDSDLSKEDVWSSAEKLRDLQKKKSSIQDLILPLELASEKVTYLDESLSILNEDEGEIFFEEINRELTGLRNYLDEIELRLLLSGDVDKNNAIVTIHPGAGGIESMDWAEMLMKMYLKWCERRGFKSEVMDLQMAEEAGIKSVTFSIEGPYAYGYMKTEAGIHRLVRISPFDANKRRHTSFSAVLVYPEIAEDGAIDIRDEDIKLDTFRSSGAGGQHVNKVSSAVRITHMPSGIIVACQSERSQHRNREMAMKILRSRLYDLQQKEREKKMEDFAGDKKDISWGNQIRSYVLQPYRLVKDHRTNIEVGNVDAVLEGDIDVFIEGYLRSVKSMRHVHSGQK
ncbi:MAG TPA: peptide chain release factor 2 [Dissulfurispiraceae bacterium]|nr:peptide chain release factor 2 [Dissulfurispiraceae bacterium]